MEQLCGVVRGVMLSRSMVVCIPREIRDRVGFEKGEKFSVKIDENNRIIYEAIGSV
jgi:bifunctional DNA-binding transcriptional regulator/antitoxin component of YhaV-PrlF toxin-antitoxin module